MDQHDSPPRPITQATPKGCGWVQRGPRISTLLEARKGSQKFNILDESNVCFLLSTFNHSTNMKREIPSIFSYHKFILNSKLLKINLKIEE